MDEESFILEDPNVKLCLSEFFSDHSVVLILIFEIQNLNSPSFCSFDQPKKSVRFFLSRGRL